MAERRGELPLPLPIVAHTAIALACALLYALSPSAWLQAVRAEVYALHALLAFGVVHQLLAWDAGDAAALGRASLLFGLGLGNHHLLMLLVGAVALPWAASRPRRREIVRSVPFALVALALLVAYLPIRASRGPEVDWGAPTTPARLAWLLSAAPFQRTASTYAALQPLGERLAALLWTLVSSLGLGVAAASLGGLWLLLRLRATRPAGVLLAGVALANLVSPALVGFDPQNPDAHGYALAALAVGVLGAAALAAGALAILAHARPAAGRVAARLVPILAAVALLPAARGTGDGADLSRAFGADLVVREVLDATPPGATLVTHDFQTAFGLWYLRRAEGARPDVTHVHAGFMGFPGYATPARRAALADPTAVVEYDDHIPDARLAHLAPAGLVLRPDGSLGEHRARWLRLDARLARLPPDAQTRRAILWARYRAARYFCRRAMLGPARDEIAAARALSRSPLLDRLERACERGTLPP